MPIHKPMFFGSPDETQWNPGRQASDLTKYSWIPLSYIAYKDVGEGRKQERKLPGYITTVYPFMDER